MTYFNFNIWQDGMKVAGSSSRDQEAAHRDAMHYAMMYEQDGPVVVKQGNRIVYRTPLCGSGLRKLAEVIVTTIA